MISLFELFSAPRRPPTPWERFCDFAQGLVFYVVVTFFGVMAVVGMTVTGLLFIRWLFAT